jgi:hypothetical protein
MSLQAAISDFKRFTSNGGFSVPITLTSPVAFIFNSVSITSINIKGIAAKHFTDLSTEGLPINSKNARITIIESDLIAFNYPVRNAKGEISLINHFIDYADSTGIVKHMRIKEQMPDETVGSITCFLGDYATS